MLTPVEGLQNLKKAAESAGATLLSADWLGAGENRYLFRCKNQFHPDFEKSYAKAVDSRQGCLYCSRNRPASDEEAEAVLRACGYRFEGAVSFAAEKIEATCLECGRVHRSSYSELRRRSCAHKQKSDEAGVVRVRKKVEELGGLVLNGDFSSISNRWGFRCSKGHEFTRTAQSVLPSKSHEGRFCNLCAGVRTTASLADIEQLVLPKGGALISIPQHISSKAKLLISCNLGHEFEKSLSHLQRGQWCPICSKGSKSEEIARTVFQTLFAVEFRKQRPKWLRYPLTGRLLELDGYNEELQLAFEYQGAQHRDWRIGNEGQAGLRERLARDEWKRKKVREEGVTLIELWDTTDYEDFGPEIERQLLGAGRLFPEIDFRKGIDLDSAFIRDNRLEELRQRVASRSISLHSSKWIGVHSAYEFMCQVCGHTWKREAASYLYARLAGCEMCGYTTGSAKRKRGIQALHAIAHKHGGVLLSESYKTIRDDYLWRCKEGHEFKGNASNMESRNTFCNQCGKITVGDLTAYAESHGGSFLSQTYKKVNDIYQWQCSIHGSFERRFREMTKSGGKKFCVECDKSAAGLRLLEDLAKSRGGTSLNQEWFGKKHSAYSFICGHGQKITIPGWALFYRDRWCSCENRISAEG